MATVISLLTNPCNSPFDQQHSHHLHHHPQQLLFPPYGQGPETFQQRYSGTGGGGRTRNEATFHHHQLDALDFHLLSRTLEEEVEQMEYSGSSGPYQYHQHDQQQQQPQQQAARRQGQQDFEQISPGYNLDNEDTYSGSPNNFQDYQNNFVDSPPDSKEPWPIDYNKMHTTIASSSGANDTTNASTTVTAVAVANGAGAVVAAATSHQQQQQQQQQDNGGMYMNNAILPSRKRRMEWMSPQEEDTDGTETKIANIDKERDARRKGSLRWADDLDLDLSNELSSNGYISDSLLTFPVFKQELPSPPQKPPQQQQQQQLSQSAHQQQQQQQHQLHQQQQQQQQQQPLHQQAAATSSQDHSQQSQHQHAPANSLQQSLAGGVNPANSGNAANTHQQQPQQQQQVVQYHQQQQQQGHSSMNGAGQSLMSGTDHHATGIGAGLSNLQSFLQSNRLENDPSAGVLQMQQDGTLPVARGDKTHDDHNRFQYVLAAATSIATKNNEESLTYLNQGQSYEIKLKKLGDLSPFRGKILKSIIKICFHERRLQYMEREQMQLWQASRPGERILDVDIPLSYGLMQVQPTSSNLLNTIEVFWDPMKEVGVYVKVNCISTEFTPKKHGGEKGVPFRIQVETYIDTNGLHNGTGNGVAGVDDKDGIRPLHAAACQIKVFKLKGADRKHKQDREKILKRPVAEQEKYQRSCDCTILTDITTDSVITPLGGNFSPDHIKRNVSPLLAGPTSPGQLNKFENIMSSVLCNGGNVVSPGANPTTTSTTTTAAAMVVAAAAAVAAGVQNNPIGISNVSSTNGLCKASPLGVDQPMGGVLSPQQPSELDDYVPTITKETSPGTLAQWLAVHRLSAYAKTFAQFSGSDLLRMSKDDLCKICGLADGIRMFNILHSKAITPRLTIYVSFQTNIYHAIYLHSNTIPELVQNLSKIPGFLEAINALNTPNSATSDAGLWSGTFGGPPRSLNTGSSSNGAGTGGHGKLSTTNGPNSGVQLSVPSPSSPISSSCGIARLQLLLKGPNGIQVLLTEDVLNNIKDETLFQLELKPNGNILMKAVHSVTGTAGDCSIDDDG